MDACGLAPTQLRAAPLEAAVVAPTMTVEQDTHGWPAVLQRYDPIDLSEMGHVALLRRTDTKHLLSEEQLYQALSQLTGHYRILEIEGRRLHRYQTLYFDTQDLALYRQHHDGWRNRYKVRERAYADSGLAYLEVKHKVNAGRTVKSRIRTPTLSAEIARDARPFLHRHYPYPVEALEPALFNTFRRITLVSRHGIERVTVDLGLRFWWDGEDMSLDGVSVAEVKQDRLSAGSPFLGQMRALGVRATPFSKYCMGVCMLYPEVKYNRFKPQLRQIAMLSHEGRSACQTYN